MILSDVSMAVAGADCRIGVALALDAPFWFYRVDAAAARNFSESLRGCPDTLIVIDDQPSAHLKRMPSEQLFLPPLPWR